MECKKYLVLATYTYDGKTENDYYISVARNITFAINDFLSKKIKYDKLVIKIFEINNSISLEFDKNY